MIALRWPWERVRCSGDKDRDAMDSGGRVNLSDVGIDEEEVKVVDVKNADERLACDWLKEMKMRSRDSFNSKNILWDQ